MVNYKLADKDLLDSANNIGYKIFTPLQTYIVLGRSNSKLEDVITMEAINSKIEVMKRPSGGETVILSPNMLVIAIKMPLIKSLKPDFYFKKANAVITESLLELGVKNIHSKGISDISIGNKKILGSAIFRTPSSMFYHSVLNISEDIYIISKYLKHPKREPDYRKGRTHSEFVSSLKKEGFSINKEELTLLIEKKLSSNFFTTFA